MERRIYQKSAATFIVFAAMVVADIFHVASGQTPAASATGTPPAAPAGSAKQLIQALEDKLYADDKQKATSGDYNRNTNLLSELAQFVVQVDSGKYNVVLSSWDQISRGLDSRYYADAKAIQQQLMIEETQSEKEALKQVEEMIAQMKDPILAAKTDTDLDDLWLKLTHQQRDFAQRGYGYNNGYGSDNGPVTRLNGALIFVTGWQNYLANKNAGYTDAATSALQRLTATNGSLTFPLLPKAEIEKRIAELASSPSHAGAGDVRATVDALVDGMHEGKDASAVLIQLATLSLSNQDALSSQVTLLQSELKSLVACTVDAQEGRYGNILATAVTPPKTQSPWYPKLSKFFSRALTDVLPSFVNWKEMPPRHDGEKPDDYILRCALAAKAQQSWWTELNLLEVWRNYSLHGGTPTWLLGDLYSLQNMINGENLENAGQFEPAIVYYQGAVRFASKYGPGKEAADKIKALQQSQPEAYATAVKEAQNYFIVPPADLGQVPDSTSGHAPKDH